MKKNSLAELYPVTELVQINGIATFSAGTRYKVHIFNGGKQRQTFLRTGRVNLLNSVGLVGLTSFIILTALISLKLYTTFTNTMTYESFFMSIV